MKIVTSLILLSLSLNSSAFFGKEDPVPKELEMVCLAVGHNIMRCENKEVICYAGKAGYTGSNMGDAGIHCQFKEKK